MTELAVQQKLFGHERESFLADIQICKSILTDPGIMIIDDTKEELHPCCHVYQNEIKNSEEYICYDYDNWNVFVGMSIIKRKQI